jgi:hypothetical protein
MRPRSPCIRSCVGCARRWRCPRSPCTAPFASCARRCCRPRSARTCSSLGYAGISSSAASSWPFSPSSASPSPPIRSPPRLPLPSRPGTLGTCPAASHADSVSALLMMIDGFYSQNGKRTPPFSEIQSLRKSFEVENELSLAHRHTIDLWR